MRPHKADRDADTLDPFVATGQRQPEQQSSRNWDRHPWRNPKQFAHLAWSVSGASGATASAVELAEPLRLALVTARRYLEQLANTGLIPPHRAMAHRFGRNWSMAGTLERALVVHLTFACGLIRDQQV